MTTQNDANRQGAERDLTIHQRNLVDTCFEENQYEAAISVLDEMRSSKYKPFPPHIRQLIYIALYPPSTEEELDEEAMKLEPGSPSKLLSRRQKTSLAPSPKAISAATDLLVKFARTNAPGSLARAIPSYPEDPNIPTEIGAEHADSHIAIEALRIGRARCCWEIIKEGFIRRDGGKTTSSPRKPRTRKSTRRMSDDDEDEGDEMPAPVSEHAWGVLGWLLTVFERDEAEVEQSGQIRYSPLLLSQLPPSRPASSPRWDVKLPVDVVFYALEQESESRRSLGVRLLNLLVNLGSTTLLDFSMFLNAVSSRLSGLSLDVLTYLLAALPVTRATAQFKLDLCRHALGGTAAPGRPKPQARARAQPRRRQQVADAPAAGDASSASQDVSTTTGQGSGANNAPSIARRFPSISALDVLALLERPKTSGSPPAAQAACLKGELVLGYGLLQRQLDEDDRDQKWAEMLRDGTLEQAVEEAFDLRAIREVATAETRDYVEKRKVALLAVLSLWRL
ncbi:hypothetical protein ONZ51_g4184 [Trametes cubensis]|uniref:Uncharacterized protein n=1 Tax=Trametes cubensis TaxID=1111947 RepID=A0AAD7TWB8_9APHY|nr:hypothetical protein ONZ51_g4184 [Trametes cubensis]